MDGAKIFGERESEEIPRDAMGIPIAEVWPEKAQLPRYKGAHVFIFWPYGLVIATAACLEKRSRG